MPGARRAGRAQIFGIHIAGLHRTRSLRQNRQPHARSAASLENILFASLLGGPSVTRFQHFELDPRSRLSRPLGDRNITGRKY
jgi:hypothetical protein